jgi:hypothetical protein
MCEGAGERVSCVTRRARLVGEWVWAMGLGRAGGDGIGKEGQLSLTYL